MTIPRHRPRSPLWFALLGAGMLAGLLGLGAVLLHGQPEVYNATREIPWGVLISIYILLIVSSGGLGLVWILGRIFHIDHLEFIGKKAALLAILTLLCGLGITSAGLHNQARTAFYIADRSGFSSAVHWTAILYSLNLVLLCAQFFLIAKKSNKAAFAMGVLGFIAATSAHYQLLAAFGLREDGHLWPGAILPIYFIFSAMVSGGVVVSLASYFNQREGAPPFPRRCREIMGKLERLRCLFMAILVLPVVCGILFVRCHMVVIGKVVSIGDEIALLQYTPSVAEIAIAVGAISTCLYLYTIAEKFLPLEGEN